MRGLAQTTMESPSILAPSTTAPSRPRHFLSVLHGMRGPFLVGCLSAVGEATSSERGPRCWMGPFVGFSTHTNPRRAIYFVFTGTTGFRRQSARPTSRFSCRNSPFSAHGAAFCGWRPRSRATQRVLPPRFPRSFPNVSYPRSRSSATRRISANSRPPFSLSAKSRRHRAKNRVARGRSAQSNVRYSSRTSMP